MKVLQTWAVRADTPDRFLFFHVAACAALLDELWAEARVQSPPWLISLHWTATGYYTVTPNPLFVDSKYGPADPEQRFAQVVAWILAACDGRRAARRLADELPLALPEFVPAQEAL